MFMFNFKENNFFQACTNLHSHQQLQMYHYLPYAHQHRLLLIYSFFANFTVEK